MYDNINTRYQLYVLIVMFWILHYRRVAENKKIVVMSQILYLLSPGKFDTWHNCVQKILVTAWQNVDQVYQ